ncbi:MAG: PIN domain-containing protein [Spirochaetes bacterium]|uniref:PIN domain-containing protein n=1 Tax=Candidatus Ornithospirochaeta stercoravium TaxID=2840897 RepID=A0A9D9IB38_9SPIO|nr:PIN domain-containing protein [Candidatus Ornithospirochaeta stercoravium]
MRRIADTNILVRYLTGDDAKAAAKATEIIRNGVEVIPETISEVLYVLTSKILYAIPRPDAAKAIIALLDDISIDRETTIRNALNIFGETRLDYVDCLLIAEGLSADTEIMSFDRKLLNELKRRVQTS